MVHILNGAQLLIVGLGSPFGNTVLGVALATNQSLGSWNHKSILFWGIYWYKIEAKRDSRKLKYIFLGRRVAHRNSRNLRISIAFTFDRNAVLKRTAPRSRHSCCAGSSFLASEGFASYIIQSHVNSKLFNKRIMTCWICIKFGLWTQNFRIKFTK